jgi:hypothetical protein
LGVRLARGVTERHGDVQRPGHRHGPARGCERALERHAVQVLHDDVERAVGQLADEKNVHHVGMREARGHLRLAVEARDDRRIRRELAVQDLHRDVPVDPFLESAVHAPHRANADELADLDVPQDLAAEVGVRRGGGGNGPG